MPTKMKLKAPYKQTLLPKKTKPKTKYQTNTHRVHFVLVTPGHETCPGMWLIHPTTFHWRKLIFPFQAITNCKQNLSYGEICEHLRTSV